MTKENAMLWLWGTSFLNLGLGVVIWVFNKFQQQNLNFWDSGYDYDKAQTVIWQAIGSNLFGFGVLVLVITFATAAVVDTISSSKSSNKAE